MLTQHKYVGYSTKLYDKLIRKGWEVLEMIQIEGQRRPVAILRHTTIMEEW
jgi:hypothetical protein